MSKMIHFCLMLFILATGCTEHQREGWSKRIENLFENEEQEAKPDTLNSGPLAVSEEKQNQIGLETAFVKKQGIADILETPAELVATPNNVVSINAPISGRVTSLRVTIGTSVEKNALVAILENPQNLGQKYQVRAPISGIVTQRPVNTGEWIESGARIVRLVDYRTMDGVMRLYEDEVDKVKIGQTVEFVSNGITAQGQILFISPYIDPKTRTTEARATVSNLKGQLQANAYATARISIAQKQALVVPKSAVLPEEAHFIVVVRQGDRFEKRVVEVGLRQKGIVEILSGVREGEEVVTQGAYELKNINFTSAGGGEEEE